MALAGAVSRNAAGQDCGAALGLAPNGVTVSASLAEALEAPSDVVVDYTKPDVVKAEHAACDFDKGRHVVIGTSGLGAADYAEIDAAARANGVGVHRRRQFLDHRHADEALRADGGEICAGCRDHRLCQRQEARCAVRHRARACRGARRCTRRFDREAGRRSLGRAGNARGGGRGREPACRCIRCGCRPTSCPARRCSACPTNG